MHKFNSAAFTALGLGAAFAVSLAISATPAGASAASKLKTYDTNKDGTLDLKEVTAGAGSTFDRLNKDKDDTLDMQELHGRLSKKEFAAGDPDKDKTLTKAEYIVIVTRAFNAANKDKDGTLDLKELKTKDGLILVRLLK